MVIERTTDEFVIRFPLTADTEQMQDIMDYLRYKELTANRRIAQSEVDKLSREVNRRWWEQNADKFKK
jgi:HAMP domain-containing protein